MSQEGMFVITDRATIDRVFRDWSGALPSARGSGKNYTSWFPEREKLHQVDPAQVDEVIDALRQAKPVGWEITLHRDIRWVLDEARPLYLGMDPEDGLEFPLWELRDEDVDEFLAEEGEPSRKGAT